ncbi:phosphotransferase family protein [Amycolatopsis sp. NPDC098790]|uniref:phosphotransferase family protein n=1 Tax=Amycolatopsis sp. NPDC098790 TaxID=3363939 RepID=UPI0038097B04
MPRSTWEALPAAVRAAIEHEAGDVREAVLPSAGRNSDFSATLYTAAGPVFCKGIAEAGGKRGRMHRHEAAVNPILPVAVAPRLLWRLEADGWLVLGFEHCPGRHVDLSPGSSDLDPTQDAIATMSDGLNAVAVDAPVLAEQWARLAAWRRLAKDTPSDLDLWARDHLDQLTTWEAAAAELVAGDTLAHTDLHALNLLAHEGKVRIVDWAWSRRGNPAVDAAFLITRLIEAGHDPVAAEARAETMPIWQQAPPRTRTAFAVEIWGIWEYLERHQPLAHRAALTAAARKWARYRLSALR